MVELPSLLVTIFSLLVNNSFAFVIAPPWADDNTNPCSEVRKHPPSPKVLREDVKKRTFYRQADRKRSPPPYGKFFVNSFWVYF